MTIKKTRAFFFDMDGTVMNTEPHHAKALQILFEQYNQHFSVEELQSKYQGLSDTEVYSMNKEIFHKVSLEKFLEQKNSIFIELIQQLSQEELNKVITPGIFQYLKKLKEHKVIIALISASEKEIINLLLERCNLTSYFDLVRPRCYTFCSKPSPSPYLSAMRHFRLRSDEVVIFEDSLTGLTAAHSSGATTVQIKPLDGEHHFTHNIPVSSTIPDFRQLSQDQQKVSFF